MKKLITICMVLALILTISNVANATYYVKYDFETPWSGPYTPGWDCSGYRHGEEPDTKMEQVQLTVFGRSGYGVKVYVDSVPEDWMWWGIVEVVDMLENSMNTEYDPWVSVYMYDAGYTSGKDATGQLYPLPSHVTGDDDWTDVQFGGRTVAESVYYYTWADVPHPGWQATSVSRPDLNNDDNPVWVQLKIQLSSSDNKLHYYINGSEVGVSDRNDYLDLGSLGLGVMFDNPLSGWGGNKPYVIFDDFEFGSTIPEPATICLLGLGGLALLRKKR